MSTFLSSPEDLRWLSEGHLATCRHLPPFAVATLDGNEDSPDAITLYEYDHVNSLTLTLRPDAVGHFAHNSNRY